MEEKRKQEKYEAMHRQDCNVKERQRYHNAKEWHRQEVMTREKPQDERKQWKQHVREIERERSLEAIAACNMKLNNCSSGIGSRMLRHISDRLLFGNVKLNS